jgi:hypothetical protein
MEDRGALGRWVFSPDLFNQLYGSSSDDNDSSSTSASSDDDDEMRSGRSMRARFTVEDRYQSLFYKHYLDPARVEQDD